MRSLVTHVKNILSPEECREIIDDQIPWLSPGLTGGGKKTTKEWRKSDVAFIPNNHPHLKKYISRIHKVIADIARTVHQTEITAFEHAQFTRYKSFGFYKPHNDVQIVAPMRTISATIELSNPQDYIGGGITIYSTTTKGVKQPKEQGTLITFPSLALHEANTVYWGTRYSLVIWGFARHPNETDPALDKWKRKT